MAAYFSAFLIASFLASASKFNFLIKASAYLSTSSFLASFFGFGGKAFGIIGALMIFGSSGSGSPKTFAFFHSNSLFFCAFLAAILSALAFLIAAFLASIFFFFKIAFYFAYSIKLSVAVTFLIFFAKAYNFASFFFYLNKAFCPFERVFLVFGPNFFALALIFFAFLATF